MIVTTENTIIEKRNEKLLDLLRLQKAILENIPVLQYEISLDGIILNCNDLVVKKLGYENKRELIGKPLITTIYAPSSVKKAKKLFLKWKKTGSVRDEEIQIKTKKGEVIDVLLNVGALFDKNGEIQCSISSQTDISKYKKIENQIKELSKFPSENPSPVLRIDYRSRIIYANDPGKNILRDLGVKNKKIPKNLIDSLRDSIKKSSENAMVSIFKIGKRTYEFNIIKVKNSDYYNIYGTDISERVKIEKIKRKKEEKQILLDDRSYIARELHDTVTQTLFSANLIAEVLPRLWERDPEGVINRLKEIRLLNSVALTEMRSLIFELKPSSFRGEDISNLLRELIRSTEIKSKIPIAEEIVKEYEHSHKIELSFYRIAQEALSNIVKHSAATKGRLVFKSLPDKITLNICDNGVGFILKEISHENFGLLIMQERAKLMGASLEIISSPDKGTKISVKYNRHATRK